MPKRYFKIELSERTTMYVFFETAHGIIVSFNVIRKVWYEFLDNKQALDIAIKELKENHELYIERFMKWLQ